ncbi:uncharacterized protein LOC132263833 [Phlebotomus argentipes]|uniref:uncharacterized protein LOC132263833 n=1 Tax=Phlebotomus argentipes TaxID=94469 RepID=UPI002892A96B|nr:uncharacterized protein LOC132263833 [Phlebotomus argentipes]
MDQKHKSIEVGEENVKMEKREDKVMGEESFFAFGKGDERINEALKELMRVEDRKKHKASVLEALRIANACLGSDCDMQLLLNDAGMKFCLIYLAPMLIDEDEVVSENAVNILLKLLPFITRENVTPVLMLASKSTSKKIASGLIAMRDREISRWHEIWCVWLKLLMKFTHPRDLSSVNGILKVVEGGFKHTNIDIRAESFVCWKTFLEILVAENELTENRIGNMAIPLYYTTNFNSRFAEAKFSTWWFLLCNSKGLIDSKSTIVVTPFLQFCFEPYTTGMEGRNVTDLVTLSPGKQVKSLREKVICALVYLLGSATEATKALHNRCALECSEERIINFAIYSEIETEVILSCQEATLMLIELTGVDTIGISQNIWDNLSDFLNRYNEDVGCLKTILDVLEVLRIQCEKDPRAIPHFQIVMKILLGLEKGKKSYQNEKMMKMLEISQQIINLLLNTTPEIITSDKAEKISVFMLKFLQKSCIYDAIMGIMKELMGKIDVSSINNHASLKIVLRDYVALVKKYARGSTGTKKKTTILKTACEHLLKWCVHNYELYKNTDQFIEHWKLLCAEMEPLGMDKLHSVFSKNFDPPPEGFRPIFMSFFPSSIRGDKDMSMEKDGDDSFVEIPSKSVPMVTFKTNLLTETQKEKLRTRADDIPALYNDLTQSLDTMPVSETSQSKQDDSSSSIERAQKRKMRELDRLKTDTVEGQNVIVGERSTRRKSSNNPEQNSKPAEEPKMKRRSSTSNASDTKPPDDVQKKKLRRNSMCQEKPRVTEKRRDSLNTSQSLLKKRKPSTDHNYHILLENNASLEKKSESSPQTPKKKDTLNYQLMKDMMKNVRDEFKGYSQGGEDISKGQSLQSNEDVTHIPNRGETTPKKISPTLKVRAFAHERRMSTTETQDLFPETPEPPKEQKSPEKSPKKSSTEPIETVTDDTLVQTQEENLSETPNALPESLDVECVSQPCEATLNSERSPPNPLTKILIRVQSNKRSHKSGFVDKPVYRIKETHQPDLATTAMVHSSPKFTSRAAQMLSMTSSSPSSSKQQEAVVQNTPVKGNEVLFRFSSPCPPANATPKLSILKRKREMNLNESVEKLAKPTKKRRISFHDPPVTKTKEYILDDFERASKKQNDKAVDNEQRRNLLKDSPPKCAENGENDSDWEDLEDVTEEIEHPVVFKRSMRLKERRKTVSKSRKVQRSAEKPPSEMNGHAVTPVVSTEVELKKVFNTDDEVMKYVWEHLENRIIDEVETRSEAVKSKLFTKLLSDKTMIEKMGSIKLMDFAQIFANTMKNCT